MGGAATVCVVTDNARKSYMAYNDAMGTIANDANLLSADVSGRVELADVLFKEQSREAAGKYFSGSPGLAPQWYGLNLIDVDKQRIWWCQGYSSLPVLLPFRGIQSMISDNPNIVQLARNGMLRMVSDSERHEQLNSMIRPDGTWSADHLPVVDEQRLLTLGDQQVHYFVVSAPGWEYRNFFDDMKGMYDAICAEYTLTDSEKETWTTYFRDRNVD
jgi:hypothetical protein